MSHKVLIANDDCIDEKFIDEFVNTHDGLPILLLNILDDLDSEIETKRYKLYGKFPHLEELDGREIEITSRLLKEGKAKEAEEFQVGYAIEFLERHPRFRCMARAESQISGDIRIMIGSIREAFLGDIDYF